MISEFLNDFSNFFDQFATKESTFAYLKTLGQSLINYLINENYELFVLICAFLVIVLIRFWAILKSDESYPPLDK